LIVATPAAYVPAEQVPHLCRPESKAKLPTGQFTQLKDPVAAAYVPNPQDTHAPALVVAE